MHCKSPRPPQIDADLLAVLLHRGSGPPGLRLRQRAERVLNQVGGLQGLAELSRRSACPADRTEQVVAAMLIAARQGLALRERVGLKAGLHGELAAMYADLGATLPLVEEDRALDGELRLLLGQIRDRRWGLYDGA